MKKTFFGVILVLMALSSCMDTSYVEPEQSFVNVGITDFLGDDYLIINDGGERLLATTIPSDYEFEAGTRVKIVFKNPVKAEEGLGYSYTIDVTDIETINVRDLIVIDDLNRDTLGDAGIQFNDVYVAGRFLNVDMSFNGGGKPHYFSVSYDPDGQSEDENEITYVFHHKDNDDNMGVSYRGFLSYDLYSIDKILLPPYKLIFKGVDLYGQDYEKIIDVE